MRKRKMKRGLAYLLCMALVFEGTGISVLAEETQVVVAGEAQEAVMDELVVSSGDAVSCTVAENSNGTMSGDDVSGNSGATENIASGTYYGMDWVIDGNGLLTISGEYDPDYYSYMSTRWDTYSDSIISVKIEAKGMPATYCWFEDHSKLQSVDLSEFDASQVTNMSFMFAGCTSLIKVDFSGVDTSQVIDMRSMFGRCSSLTEINFSGNDVSKVTDMRNMLYDCSSLTEISLVGLDVSNVTNMSGMFSGCTALTSLDMTGCNLKMVEDADLMFYGCDALASIKVPLNVPISISLPGIYKNEDVLYMSLPQNLTESILLQRTVDVIASGKCCGMDWVIDKEGHLSISGKDDSTSRVGSWLDNSDDIISVSITATDVTSTEDWFYNCANLQSVDMSRFDASKLQNMSGMFMNCSGLTDLDLSMLNTENVSDMSGLFSGCTNLTSLNLNALDTGNVTNMHSMFRWCKNLTNLSLVGWDTGKVTDMSGMFSGCTSLTELDLSMFNTENVTSMSSMFASCSNLSSLNLSGFDTDKVQSMSDMFQDCISLTALDLSGWNTDCVEDMSRMFERCESLSTLNLEGFGTSQVLDMQRMFSQCYSLLSLDVSGFDTSKVTNMRCMFRLTSSLTTLDLSNFNTLNVTDMGFMFDDCEALENLDLSGFDMSNVIDAQAMFQSCENIKTIKTPKNLSFEVFLDDVYFDNVGNIYPCLPQNLSDSIILTTDESIIAGGYYKGLGWFISSDGILTVSGQYKDNDYSGEYPGWIYYTEDIISAKIKTMGVEKTDYWFQGCNALSVLDLSEFDMSQVESAVYMFKDCSNLETIYTPINLNIDVALSGVYLDAQGNKYTMLPAQTAESIVLERDKSVISAGKYYGMDWIVDRDGVLTISGQYDGSSEGDFWGIVAESIKTAKVSAIGVESTNKWFYNFYNLSSVDFSSFDTSKVTNMRDMFYGCTNLTEIDVSKFVTSSVTDMQGMFSYCGVTSLDLRNFDTRQVKNMRGMFYNCNWLKNLDISKFETEQVTDMAYMFGFCMDMETLDLSNFDTSSVVDMRGMFQGCETLVDLNVSSFETNQVTNMFGMFNNCSALKNLDVTNFVTDKVIDMKYMFLGCCSLTSLNVQNFDTRKVEEIAYIFGDNSSLKMLDMSSFDLSNVRIGNDMLDNCTALQEVKTPKNLDSTIPLPKTMYDESGKSYTALPIGLAKSIVLIAASDGNDDTDTNDGGDDTDTNDGGDDEGGITEGLIVSNIPDLTYTGKAHKPIISVKQNGKLLVAGVDYTVTYKNNINAATVDSAKAPTVIVKGKGNYTGTISVKFNILPRDLKIKTSYTQTIVAANGKVQKAKSMVWVEGKKLVANKDYTIEYPDKTDGAYKNPGTYNVVIKGMGNYQGSITIPMIILGDNQIMASKLKVSKIPACTYVEGTPATPSVTVSYKGKELELGKDYAVSYINNDKAGKASLIITGLQNAEGTYVAGAVVKSFTIKGTAIKKADITYNNSAIYSGLEICPAVTLKDGVKTLRPNVDYTVEYTKNVNVGKGTILIIGKGGYTGTVKKTFTIQADASVANKLKVTFVGGKAEAAFDQKGAKPAISVALGNTILKSGKDYTVSYKNNKKLATTTAGKAPMVVIKGKGNYKFTKEVPFAIVEKNLTDADISVESADKFVGGKKGYLSAPVVKDGNGKKLKVNKDYKVVGYTVNGAAFDGSGEVPAGTTVTVTVEGVGNYKGQTSTTYRIANNDISKVKVNKPKLEYNGGKVKFTEEMLKEGKLELTDKTTGKKLVYGTDFVVVGYKNNTRKGTATVTVRGIGEYGGTKNVKFSISSKTLK